MMLTIGASTPAVSHVPASPGAGAASNTQRKHGVCPGMIVIVCPWLPIDPPYTHGLPSFTEMSLRDPGVAELRYAFEQVAIRRLTDLITAATPRTSVPDPEATAFVLYGSAMQCAHGLAEYVGPSTIDVDRAKSALTAFIERALFPG